MNYKALIEVFELVPKTDIRLDMDISFGIFESKKEAEKEGYEVQEVILQKNPLSLKILTKTNEYVIDNKSIIFKKVKDESVNKLVLSDDDLIELKDFNLEKLAKYFNNGYSFQVIAYGTEEIIIPIDEFNHFG